MAKSEQTPMQPIMLDLHGTPRFKKNAIVSHLLDRGSLTMNDIARQEFSDEDRMQFAQLIGYSTCGYGELSYVSKSSRNKADRIAERLLTESNNGT